MFCPKCNNELKRINNELTCSKGQMELSENLEQGLTECFILKKRKPKGLKLSFLIGGNWFCPGCGVLMKEKDGFIRCSKCNLSLNEFIFALVELHPHLKEKQEK